LAGAGKALERYLAETFAPPKTSKGAELLVAEVLGYYAKERMPHTKRPDSIRVSLEPLFEFWGTRPISEIKGASCREYVAWRQKWSKVAESTARHDLVNLSAALGYYHKEFTLDALPVVTLPDKSKPRERWLDRGEIARLIWAAWREPRWKHVARFILISYYTGTRSTAVTQLRWLPSVHGGWIDLDAGLLYRKGLSTRETKKRQTPAKIHRRLLPFLRRWRDLDAERGLTHVVHYNGKPVIKLRRSWDGVRQRAGLAGDDVVQHTFRHSAATWLMQAGVPIFEAAGYLGMTPETLERVYAHQTPDFQSAAAAADPPRARKKNVIDLKLARKDRA
jgi:integrase